MSASRRTALCLLAAAGLGGCMSLPAADPKVDAELSVYTLRPSLPDKPAGRAGAMVAVDKPTLPAGFPRDRVSLLFEPDHRVDYYADAKWAAPLDELLQQFVIGVGRARLTGKTVDVPDASKPARYRLAVKLTDFAPVYQGTPDGVPRLDVAMVVTVFALPQNTVRKEIVVKKSAQASENRLGVIVDGLQTLLQTAADEALREAATYLK